jgi:hypothetical protein
MHRHQQVNIHIDYLACTSFDLDHATFFKKLEISIVNVSDLINHVCAKIPTHGRMLHATTMTNSSPSDATIIQT